MGSSINRVALFGPIRSGFLRGIVGLHINTNTLSHNQFICMGLHIRTDTLSHKQFILARIWGIFSMIHFPKIRLCRGRRASGGVLFLKDFANFPDLRKFYDLPNYISSKIEFDQTNHIFGNFIEKKRKKVTTWFIRILDFVLPCEQGSI